MLAILLGQRWLRACQRRRASRCVSPREERAKAAVESDTEIVDASEAAMHAEAKLDDNCVDVAMCRQPGDGPRHEIGCHIRLLE